MIYMKSNNAKYILGFPIAVTASILFARGANTDALSVLYILLVYAIADIAFAADRNNAVVGWGLVTMCYSGLMLVVTAFLRMWLQVCVFAIAMLVLVTVISRLLRINKPPQTVDNPQNGE